MESLTLVVNLSLRSIRTILFDAIGKKLHEDWLPIRTYINGSSVEQDPNEWWELLQELLRKIFAHEKYGKRIRYITVTSSALCLVMVDKKGQVLEKSFMPSDKRARDESKIIKEQFKDFFSIRPSFKVDPSFMLPKIFWTKRRRQKLSEKVKKFLSSNDFLVYKLSGQFLTDDLNAEKFYYDTKKQMYPAEILKFIGLSSRQLPKVVHPGTIVGEMASEAKKDIGISQSVTVIISTYDAICALIGSSTYGEGELNNVCGTCSSYRLFLSETTDIPASNLIVQSIPSEKLLIVGGSNNLEGGALEWVKECFYGDSFFKDDAFLYDLMEKEAQESELSANGLMFLPYMLGERMPFQDPDVRGVFFGIERFHTRKDFVRSVFEAVSFQAKLFLEEFERNGLHIASVNISGGVARLPFAAQLRSDVLGLPVHVLSEIETTALGAFILTLRARKKIGKLHDAKDMIAVEKTYLPNMHNHNCYASLFVIYKQLYNASRELFQTKRDVSQKIMHYRKKVLENL